jgi:protein O-GlcNAc transferase
MLARLIAELGRLFCLRSPSLKAVADAARIRKDWTAAADAYRNYLVTMPNDAAAHNDIGVTYCELGQYDAAYAAFSNAAACDPGLISAHLNLGHLALQQRRAYAEAVSHYLAVLKRDPDQADARRQIGLAYYELGEVKCALRYLAPASDCPIDAVSAEYALFMTNAVPDHDRQTHFEDHLRWAAPFDARMGEAVSSRRRKSKESNARIRVGYVSADFREHAVVRFLLPVLERHCREEFEIFCYANQAESDGVTVEIQQMPIAWRNVLSLGDDQLAEMIVRDRIDILVDLSGHTRGNRLGLFALKPASVQVTWLGYLNTTGMKAIDYRITDSLMDPPDVSDRLHTEKLIRLDPALWCYRAPEDVPEIAAAPCESNGYVSFGSFNHVAKLNDCVLERWSQILVQCPNSRLKLIGVPGGSTAQRFVEFFSRRGISVERLHIRGRLPRKEFMFEMSDTDIALDPFPYCGGATTCESLWMGLPVIALGGDFGFSRSSSAIITQARLEECVAVSEKEYVQKAVALAAGGVTALRISMRDRMRVSELMNECGFIQRLEIAYRKMFESAQ